MLLLGSPYHGSYQSARPGAVQTIDIIALGMRLNANHTKVS
jgi:hypothetical protein